MEKPRKIHGVTVTPRWHWSKEYRACVLDQLRPENSRCTQADYETRAAQYALWKAERDGVSVPPGASASCDWHYENGRKAFIRSVCFYGAGKRTVQIPNFNWQPHVEVSTATAKPEQPAPAAVRGDPGSLSGASLRHAMEALFA